MSKIVKEECLKRKIPYNYHTSWVDALVGNYKHVKAMSKGKEGKEGVVNYVYL